MFPDHCSGDWLAFAVLNTQSECPVSSGTGSEMVECMAFMLLNNLHGLSLTEPLFVRDQFLLYHMHLLSCVLPKVLVLIISLCPCCSVLIQVPNHLNSALGGQLLRMQPGQENQQSYRYGSHL